VNIKQIVISLIDRLAAYAAREAENEDPEETKRQEEAAARRLAEKVKIQKAKAREYGSTNVVSPSRETHGAWGSPPSSPVADVEKNISEMSLNGVNGVANDSEKDKATTVKKFRGIPEDVQLFEVFWKQVVELIKVGYDSPFKSSLTEFIQARPDLSIQDITALLVSLTNLSLSCYPDRLEYVDQVLGFAQEKIKEFSDG
jgi:vacuolar protein sorting-associated protein 35